MMMIGYNNVYMRFLVLVFSHSCTLLVLLILYANDNPQQQHHQTYLENPTKIHDALQRVGAKRLGPMGKADQRGKGDDAQQKVIQRWMEELWPLLAKALAEEKPPAAQKLEEMKQTTVNMYQKLGKT